MVRVPCPPSPMMTWSSVVSPLTARSPPTVASPSMSVLPLVSTEKYSDADRACTRKRSTSLSPAPRYASILMSTVPPVACESLISPPSEALVAATVT